MITEKKNLGRILFRFLIHRLLTIVSILPLYIVFYYNNVRAKDL